MIAKQHLTYHTFHLRQPDTIRTLQTFQEAVVVPNLIQFICENETSNEINNTGKVILEHKTH